MSNSNDINSTPVIVSETYQNKAFPDQSEDLFWKNALEAKEEEHKVDLFFKKKRKKNFI